MKHILPECTDNELWQEMMPEVRNHLDLPGAWNRHILEDYIRAINYYESRGVSRDDIRLRLDPARLGGFYAHSSRTWYPLDASAKVYPMSMKRDQMVIFRLSATLKEPVVPELLQMAMTFTIKRFPSFATHLRRGFFWHYTEVIKRRFSIEEERDVPCSTMHVAGTGSQLLRVLYYQRRISVEFFHILTDGHGGMIFLKTLVAEYLRLAGHHIPCGEGIPDISETPRDCETRNDYHRIKDCRETGGFLAGRAVQMSGRISHVTPCRIISLNLPSAGVKDVASRYGVTVTAYMLALILLAGKAATEESRGRFAIQVPIDVRSIYGSETLLNFDLYCSIGLDLAEITTMEEILPRVALQLREGTDRNRLDAMMNSTINIVNRARFVPTVIASPIARLLFNYMGDLPFSCSLSNLGIIRVPDAMKELVEKFDFVLGGNSLCRASCTLATYEDKTIFTISKMTPEPSFEEALCRFLEADGLSPRVTGSMIYED